VTAVVGNPPDQVAERTYDFVITKLLTVSVLALSGFFTAHAQGTINFANGAAGVNAPVYEQNGTTLLVGTGYIAQLFAGPVGTAWDSLTPLTPTATFGTGLNAGYFFGGLVIVPNVPAGSPAVFKVRVWTSNYPNLDAAWAARLAGDPNFRVGIPGWYGLGLPTATLTSSNLGGGANPPPNLVGLSSFALVGPVPEPSVWLLALVGAAGLYLGRRPR